MQSLTLFLERVAAVVTWPVATILLTMVAATLIAWGIQKSDNDLDFTHLIVDEYTNRISLTKFGNFTALCVSSWGFISLVVDNALTEWYFSAYMVAWAGNSLLSKWLKTKSVPPKV